MTGITTPASAAIQGRRFQAVAACVWFQPWQQPCDTAHSSTAGTRDAAISNESKSIDQRPASE